MFHQNQYYFFDHNIIKTPKSYSTLKSVYSYDVYPITSDLAEKMIKTKQYLLWEVYFNCHYYYNCHWILTGNIIPWNTSYQSIKYVSRFDSVGPYKDALVLPQGTSPAGIVQGIMIGDYITAHLKQYKCHSIELDIQNYRNQILNNILNEHK